VSDLTEKLNRLLSYVEDDDCILDRTHLADEIEACVDMADTIEVVEVRCFRCDRPFNSLPDVKYCTKECELGQTKLPYQTRDQQADFLLKAQRGQA